MMKMEYIPKESDFLELTPEQYMQYFKSHADTGEKLFALLPPNHEVVYDDIGAHDIPIVTGKEKQSMLNASKVIDDSRRRSQLRRRLRHHLLLRLFIELLSCQELPDAVQIGVAACSC